MCVRARACVCVWYVMCVYACTRVILTRCKVATASSWTLFNMIKNVIWHKLLIKILEKKLYPIMKEAHFKISDKFSVETTKSCIFLRL